jgi:signal transduction histidine kinase/CheY-like chemotaxis protein
MNLSFRLPRSLRRQFLLAVTALTLLIFAGSILSVYALLSSARSLHELEEERLTLMQEAHDLVRLTLQIERESHELTETISLDEMQANYAYIVKHLAEFDAVIDRLADNEATHLLELHHASQMFRNMANIVAQLRENELRAMAASRHPQNVSEIRAIRPPQRYQHQLYRLAETLIDASQRQSEFFTQDYRASVALLETLSQRNAHWVIVLLACSVILAGAVSRWFLGRHVLGRLQQVSRNLRLGKSGDTDQALQANESQARDEIDEMAHAVELFQEDRRRLGERTDELRLARDAAEAANKAKSVFLANMSHELRTPLNAILGFSSLMRRDASLTRNQCENLDIINRSGEHLLTLINDVLEIAKIESGKLQLETVPFDLDGMVAEVTEMMRLRAEQKGLKLLLDRSSEFPRYVRGDEARLRQILVNLVSNAVKFTEQGSVTIRLGVKNCIRHHLSILVEDTGPGISQEACNRLFQPFVQFGGGSAQGGSGLGLAIAHQFAQLMGGDISVQSTQGKGSLFRVEIPLELASKEELLDSGENAHRDVAGLAPGQPVWRILIAEDQYENRLLLSQLMANIGLEIRTTENGEQCVRVFQEWHPDLIWMDRRMPVMDGVEAARRIRQLPGGDSVKIVAVTASVFKEQLPEMEAAGMDDLIRKPYRLEEVYRCLAKQLGIEYVYRDRETEANSLLPTPAMFALMPDSLVEQLHDALIELNGDRIDDIIDRIAEIDARLAQGLARLAEQFDYPTILRLLKESRDYTPPT